MHFLKLVYTASSEVPNFLDFVAVVFVDHYDSNIKITVPTQVWMDQVRADDPEYWKKQTLYWEAQAQYGTVYTETAALTRLEAGALCRVSIQFFYVLTYTLSTS
ncbi:hypothetical protein EXN66_Car000028 [Channa argus]|uniref:MHC class I-like antigen recognition-like domain-containing protein n=1 Tax=Channa argus TaxID=215402 RepID=A0A6G1QXB8_CHAAH|nr:hypothetical protein EXN66_Car000028 [Channa argus]